MENPCKEGTYSPVEAMKRPREKLVYLPCIQTDASTGKPDYVATVDVNPHSPTYCQVIYRTYTTQVGDELHHSGWNACVSCLVPDLRRSRLLFPTLLSDRIYVFDTETDPRAPRLFKTIDKDILNQKNNVGAPHTVHCMPSGEVMVSTMGDANGNGKGSFLVLDGKTFEVKGTWEAKGDSAPYGYDFWYQPRHNVMVSSEWGAPNAFRKGLDLNGLDQYGHSLHVWNWTTHKRIQDLDLGAEDGLMPLEVRFLHNPDAGDGYVGCALGSSIFRFHKKNGVWQADNVVKIPKVNVEGWILPEMPGVITDILISMDDRFLYMSNWVQGDIRQYDISNRAQPKLVGQLYLGGSLVKGRGVTLKDHSVIKEQPDPVVIKGRELEGGPQMLQLSLDGKRLYTTSSLFSAWDKIFYPNLIKCGATMVQIDVDDKHGGLKLNKDFLVDFGVEPDGPVLAHEMRFPGGDSTSDIWT